MKPLGVKVSVVCPPDTLTPGFATECVARPPETEAIAGGIKALEPAFVARKIIRGIEAKRFYIIIGATSKFYFRLKGLLPEVFLRIVDSEIRKAQKGMTKYAVANYSHPQGTTLHDISPPRPACLNRLHLTEGAPRTHFFARVLWSRSSAEIQVG